LLGLWQLVKVLRFLLFFALCLSAPVRAGWLLAETENFRVYGDMSENKLRERAALLEDYRNLLLILTNVKIDKDAPTPRLDVFLVKSISDSSPFAKLRPNIAGFYSATANGTVAYANENVMGTDAFLHEYAHHFMLSVTGGAYPRWYLEGFAEYLMTATFTPDRITWGDAHLGRAQNLAYLQWLPTEKVLANSYRHKIREEGAMFYAQSWALTHYLFQVGEGKLDAYLKDVGRGVDPVAAFKARIDPDIGHFNKKLRGYLGSRKFKAFQARRVKANPATVRILALQAAADDLLLPLAALEYMEPAEGLAEKAAELVDKAAARHPDDPMAARALALLALRYGSPEVAASRLDALLQASPNDPELLLWRAQAVPKDTPEGRRETQALLVKAFKIAPEDWRVLHAYALLRGARTEPLSAADLEVLAEAWALAPQVEAVVLDYAIALVQLDRFANAVKVLKPVANSPHGGQLAAYAAKLMEYAEAKDRPGFMEAFNMKVPPEESEEL